MPTYVHVPMCKWDVVDGGAGVSLRTIASKRNQLIKGSTLPFFVGFLSSFCWAWHTTVNLEHHAEVFSLIPGRLSLVYDTSVEELEMHNSPSV